MASRSASGMIPADVFVTASVPPSGPSTALKKQSTQQVEEVFVGCRQPAKQAGCRLHSRCHRANREALKGINRDPLKGINRENII